jgi:hypothetical protein
MVDRHRCQYTSAPIYFSFCYFVLAFGIDVIGLSVLDVICSSIMLVCMIKLIPVIIIILYY